MMDRPAGHGRKQGQQEDKIQVLVSEGQNYMCTVGNEAPWEKSCSPRPTWVMK